MGGENLRIRLVFTIDTMIPHSVVGRLLSSLCTSRALVLIASVLYFVFFSLVAGPGFLEVPAMNEAISKDGSFGALAAV